MKAIYFPVVSLLFLTATTVSSCKKSSDDPAPASAVFKATVNNAAWEASNITVRRVASTSSFIITGTSSDGRAILLKTGSVDTGTYLYRLASAPPVILETFNPTFDPVNNKAAINWSTSSETNLQKFTVERAIDSTTNFQILGDVTATGNTATGATYSFNDLNVNRLDVRIYFYRLKMIDLSGAFVYSNIRSVTNPSRSQMKLANGKLFYGFSGRIQVTRLDVTAQKIYGTFSFSYKDDTGAITEVKGGQFSDVSFK
jgi:hypothetical protein